MVNRSLSMVDGWVDVGDVAGRCGNLQGICGTLRDHCWTMLDFAGHEGHDWPIAHDRPLHDSKKWAPLWKLGGDAHHYRFFLGSA
jgi:hypothetical protein